MCVIVPQTFRFASLPRTRLRAEEAAGHVVSIRSTRAANRRGEREDPVRAILSAPRLFVDCYSVPRSLARSLASGSTLNEGVAPFMTRDVESDALLEASASGSDREKRSRWSLCDRFGVVVCVVAGLGVASSARRMGGKVKASALGVADQPQISALEALRSAACEWRRERAEQENARCDPLGTDVVVVPSLKAVYVDVTKAASESIRKRLADSFNASWTDEMYLPNRAKEVDARSTSASLPNEVLDTYKFFTFVRNPSERFVSGYHQAFCRSMCQGCERGRAPTRPPTIEQTIDLLEIMRSKFLENKDFCAQRDTSGHNNFLTNPWVDEHLQSAIYRLSGVTRRGTRVPLHFIGRVESLNEDWSRLLDELGVDSGHSARAPLEHVEHECAIAERERFLEAQSNAFHSHILSGKRAPTVGELYEPVGRIYTHDGVAVSIPKPSTKLGPYFDRLKALYEDDYKCLGY